MIDKKDLTDEVIPGLEEVYANYGSVLPAGVYTVNLGDTTHITLTAGRNKKGKPYTALQGLTFRVVGDKDGKTEGCPVGATLRFQKSWIETLVNAKLTKTQIATGEGVPLTQIAQAEFLDALAEDKTDFKVKVDWKAFDTAAYNARLVELTESQERQDPIAFAKQSANPEQKNEASAIATLAETYSDFPLNEETGQYIGSITIDKDTDDERVIRAQANVVRFFLAEG